MMGVGCSRRKGSGGTARHHGGVVVVVGIVVRSTVRFESKRTVNGGQSHACGSRSRSNTVGHDGAIDGRTASKQIQARHVIRGGQLLKGLRKDVGSLVLEQHAAPRFIIVYRSVVVRGRLWPRRRRRSIIPRHAVTRMDRRRRIHTSTGR
jgi:hypothetical protein